MLLSPCLGPPPPSTVSQCKYKYSIPATQRWKTQRYRKGTYCHSWQREWGRWTQGDDSKKKIWASSNTVPSMSAGCGIYSTLQMKGRWESNINVWFPFTRTYSQKLNYAALLFPKQSYNVLSRYSYSPISVRDLHISRIGLSIFYMWTDSGNI